MIKASNSAGEAITSSSLRVKGELRIETLFQTFELKIFNLGLSVIDTRCQHPEAYRQTQAFEYEVQRVEQIEEERSEPPVFVKQLTSSKDLKEGDYLYIEARVEPSNDDKMIVEWHKNGQYLVLGSRITTRFDFGLISLEILDLKSEDSGIYTSR